MSRLLRFAVVGHPISHSASPAMHGAAFRALGLPHTFEAVDCPGLASLKATVGLVKKGGIAGLSVTMPHKRAVMELVDEVHRSAETAGAANTLVRTSDARVVAHNTDVPALAGELRRLHKSPRTAVILGAGGAASAALEACKEIGVRVIGMTTRSWSSTEILYENETAENLRRRGALTMLWPHADAAERNSSSHVSSALRLQWLELAASADIVLQATSAGLADEGADLVADAIPWTKLAKDAVAYDLVYTRPTPFLARARDRGINAENGLGMLVEQGAIALELWLGQKAPRDVMRDAVLHHIAHR